MLRITQFVASFVPINLVILLRALQQDFVWGSVLFGGLTLIGVLLNAFIIFRMHRRSDGEYYTISSYKIAEENIVFYVVSIAPLFISAQFSDIYNIIIFSIIYALVSAICLMSKYVNVNPTLFLFGIRYFEADVMLVNQSKKVFIVSTISSMRSNRRMRLVRMQGSDWYFSLGA